MRFVRRPGEKLAIMIEVLAMNEVLHGADQGHWPGTAMGLQRRCVEFSIPDTSAPEGSA